MKVSLRLCIPIVCAALLTILFLSLIWWNVRTSTASLLQRREQDLLPSQQQNTVPLASPLPAPETQVLTSIRRGDLLAFQGEWAGAEQHYEHAVREGGGIPALRKLAQAQLQRRNFRGARATIDQLRRASVRSEDLTLLEGIVLLRTGEIQKTEQLIAAAGESPHSQYLRALLAIIHGKREEAESLLRDIRSGWEPTLRSSAKTLQAAYEEYALFPESPPIHLLTLLARALAQVQECELALPLLAQVLQEQDDYRDAWIVQGYCELTTERTEQALISLERAYALDPEKPEIQYFLARAYATLGNHRSALTFFQYSLKNGFTPESEVRRRIAQAALDSGEPLTALEHYHSLLTLPDAQIDDLIAAIEIANGAGRAGEASALATMGISRWGEEARALPLLRETIAAEQAGMSP